MSRPAFLALAAALFGLATLSPAGAAAPAAGITVQADSSSIVEVRHGHRHRGDRHRARCRHPVYETVRYWVPGYGWQRDRILVGCARRHHRH